MVSLSLCLRVDVGSVRMCEILTKIRQCSVVRFFNSALTEICAAMCFRICPYLFNSALTDLNLRNNEIGVEGGKAIAEVLPKW